MKNLKPKHIAIGVLVLIGIPIVVRTFKMFQNGFSSMGSNGENQDKDQKEDTLGTINVNWGNVTLSDSEISQINESLKNAMASFWYGTDEQAIFDALDRCTTQDDYRAIYVRFGVQPYNWLNGGFVSDMPLQALDYLNLGEWFLQELSGTDLEKVRNQFPYDIIF